MPPQVLRGPDFWERYVVFIDCKQFKIFLSDFMKLFSKAVKCQYVIRSRKEGKKEECTAPKISQRVGRSGIANIFAAVFRGQIVVWQEYTVWNGATHKRMLRILSDRLVALFGPLILSDGPNGKHLVCHDNDRVFNAAECQARLRHYGMDPMPLPVRSPWLMPLDYSIWVQILKKMEADTPNAKEKVPQYKERLEHTANHLPDLTPTLRNMCARVDILCKSHGNPVNALK